MKKILFLIILSWFSFAKIAYAFDGIFSIEEISAMSRILQAYALLSTIIVAVVAIIVVFRNAGKMRGGIFGVVLNYFGIGMVVILFGFIIGPRSALLLTGSVNTISNILFIIGYILMAIAAVRLSRAIGDQS